MDPRKSDVDAKEAYSEYLKSQGYKDIKIISSPSDISATKDGEIFYFEIKKTSRDDVYFGAATLTEWVAALKNKQKYFFVIAKSLGNNQWEFIEHTPDEFIKYSTIPPFKIFFSVPLNEKEKKKKRKNISAVRASEERINKLENVYRELRDD
jgi:hypothetical protein|tara:strand:+ start:57 stop:512 length:456 start_codon:yes stop_codon:yes gene_type:complete